MTTLEIKDLHVESELLDIQNILAEPRTNEYSRVDRVAAYALLSRLYLNAETWINQSMYNKSIEAQPVSPQSRQLITGK